MRPRLYAILAGLLLVPAVIMLMAPTGGFPSRPQFLEVKIRADDDQSLLVLEHIGEAANNRKWMWGTGGNGDPCMYFGTATDAGVPAASSVGFCRSGTTPLSVNFTPGANGVVSDHSGSGRQAAFVARGGAPALGLWIDDAAADNQEWDFKATGFGDLTGRVLNDAHTVATTWLTVNRTGTTVDLIDLAATSVTVNGAPIGGGGAIVSETAYNASGLAVGETVFISKAADTARSSTITLTADPDLQVTSLPAGHYAIEMHLDFTDGGGGMEYQFSAPTLSRVFGIGVCDGNPNANQLSSGGAFIECTPATFNTAQFHGAGGTDKAMATGTIAVTWAQNASNAAATTLKNESWLKVTRID